MEKNLVAVSRLTVVRRELLATEESAAMRLTTGLARVLTSVVKASRSDGWPNSEELLL